MRQPICFSWIGGFLLAVACAPLSPRHGVSTIDRLLRRSEDVGAKLDAEADAKTNAANRTPSSIPEFRWPIHQRIIPVHSGYGEREGRLHSGMDLHASVGTPIYAAAEGIVIYAGDGLSGYGRTVIVRHARNYSTLYAHASKIHVKAGERVSIGQRIALSGQSGKVSGPHLHFELRLGSIPINPRELISLARPTPEPVVPFEEEPTSHVYEKITKPGPLGPEN